MQALSDRTASFTDSVIRRMTRISNQYGAVNLSQGFPDFDPAQAHPRPPLSGRLRGLSSILHHLGRAELPRGAGRQADPLYGPYN